MARANIVLIDDDPLIRSLGKELLEALGYRVATAQDGMEAIQVYRRQDRVDLVILDYHLPDRNGHLVMQDILALDPGIRIMMTSGYFSSKEAARLKESGAAGLIDKPFRLKELAARIREVLTEDFRSVRRPPAPAGQT